MNRKLTMALAALAVLATPILVNAAGMFQGFPIVGGAATCSTFATNPTTGAVLTTCNGPTIPAGPTIVTGNELVPADTALTQGINPATVRIPMASLNALPISFPATITTTVPATVAANNSGGVCYTSAATITSATITLPVAPIDGQQYAVCSNATITTLAVSAGAGSTLAQTTPTALTVSATAPQGYRFIYNLASLKWFRLQ
jgi:hypothetical protein